MIIVIPSCRSVSLDYLAPLLDCGNRFIVVDDTDGCVAVDHPDFEVFDWADRKSVLGAFDDFFPRRNGACRDFGFYLAWRDCSDGDIVLALDDDCEILRADFQSAVEAALSPGPRPVLQGGARHVNILECYRDIPPGLYPRGFPYEARTDHVPAKLGPSDDVAPAFNLGLWTDAFDVNAIDKLEGPQWRHPDATLRWEQVALPPDSLISVCSMNMQFRRRLIPAAYQWPMHVPALPGWVIDRYGDIWGGFTLKVLMDRNSDCMSMGGPMVAHRKAGDLHRNIWQEHIAHQINLEMIDLIVAAGEAVAPGSYLDGMSEFAEGLAQRRDAASPWTGRYLDHLIPAMQAWLAALAAATGPGTRAYTELGRCTSGC